jgi:hypothetical protein
MRITREGWNERHDITMNDPFGVADNDLIVDRKAHAMSSFEGAQQYPHVKSTVLENLRGDPRKLSIPF